MQTISLKPEKKDKQTCDLIDGFEWMNRQINILHIKFIERTKVDIGWKKILRRFENIYYIYTILGMDLNKSQINLTTAQTWYALKCMTVQIYGWEWEKKSWQNANNSIRNAVKGAQLIDANFVIWINANHTHTHECEYRGARARWETLKLAKCNPVWYSEREIESTTTNERELKHFG